MGRGHRRPDELFLNGREVTIEGAHVTNHNSSLTTANHELPPHTALWQPQGLPQLLQTWPRRPLSPGEGSGFLSSGPCFADCMSINSRYLAVRTLVIFNALGPVDVGWPGLGKEGRRR